jgi:hypothetical protein
MSKNRFSGLSAMKTLQNSEALEGTKKDAQSAIVEPKTIPENNNDNKTPRRGRPHGKRSDENFRQVTAYINKDTYKRTKMKLLADDNRQEFSELIDSLLLRWLNES